MLTRQIENGRGRDQLREASARLGDYLSDSERIFLETCSALQGLDQQAGRLVAASSAAAAAAAHTEAEDPVARLEGGLGALGRSVEKSQAVLRESALGLSHVLAGIDALAPFAADFQRVGTLLWALAINTRIENAGCGAEGVGFQTVVSDVRRLGAQIEPKFDAVLSRARVLRGNAAEARGRAVAFLERDARALGEQIHATLAGLSALRQVRATAQAVGGQAAAASEQVAADVTQVLTVLQMHDIARQMIEHVRAEIEGLIGNEGKPGATAEVAVMASLQAEQLGRARRTLDGAFTDIAGCLSRLGEGAERLGAATRGMAQAREGTDLLQRVEQGIERSSASLREQLARERVTTDVMGRVSTSMDEVVRVTREIHRIGADVKLIALNAQVQAEKTGEDGRALAVLARAIRELSVEVEGLTSKVCEVMARIAHEARPLGAEQALEVSQATAEEAVMAEMGAVLVSLHAQHAAIWQGIQAASRDAAELRAAVTQLSRRLAASAAQAGALRDLEATLAAIGAEAATRCSAAETAAVAGRLRTAAARYTMEQERAVHRAATQVRSPAAPRAAPRLAAPASAFGDNVELF
jgi:hypothetical protein